MLITQPIRVTTSSTRLRLSALSSDSRGVVCTEGRYTGGGTAMPTYGVFVPAFAKGGAVSCVRAWSPPV